LLYDAGCDFLHGEAGLMGADIISRDVQGYPSTHWSLIYLATLPEEQAGEGALNRLLARYCPPLLAHLEFRFHLPRERAEDLLQAFVERKVLARQLLGRADRARGRFRTFLLNALDNFVKDELRTHGCARRQPVGGLVPLDEALDAPDVAPAGNGADPFEREWALTVLDEAERGTRAFYESKGRQDTWGVFRDGVLAPLREGVARAGDEELARRHGFESARQASNAIVTAKREFGKILRAVVGRYAADDADVDAELRELMTVLARAG